MMGSYERLERANQILFMIKEQCDGEEIRYIIRELEKVADK